MKKIKLVPILLLIILGIAACEEKASMYYADVDETVLKYEEYFDYQESIAGKIVTSDEEQSQDVSIAIMRESVRIRADKMRTSYEGLSDVEKEDLINYIQTEHDTKYLALVEWLKQPDMSYSELEEAIKGDESGNQSSTVNYSESIHLSSGNYTVPDDIPSGTYDIIYVSGIVPRVDVENNGDDDLFECFSESNKSFSNLTLSEGAKIRIESGTVEFRRK